jgi:subtilisin family serine protease
MRFTLIAVLTLSFFVAGIYAASADNSNGIIVKYRSAGNAAVYASYNASLVENFRNSGMSLYKVKEGKSVEQALTEIRKDPSVLYAEPDYIITINSVPDDRYYSELWGLSKISAPNAWEYTTGSNDVIVAVIDTGTDYNHIDLKSNIYINADEVPGNGIDDDNNGFKDDVYGYDFANNDADPYDDHWHGTHCAGTIGGIGNNGLGVIGVSPVVSIMPVKFLSASGSGTTSAAIRAIQYAVANGAEILSCSWGSESYSQALRDAIYDAGLHGVTVVAAAGNNTANSDIYPFYPSCYQLDNIISVGASDQNDLPASFSNYGLNSVDIFAPGVNIVSLYPGNMCLYASGTSMAAPHVAGTLALYSSFSSGELPSALRWRLMNSADRLPQLDKYCSSSARLNTGKMVINGNPSPNIDIAAVIIQGGDNDSFAESGETLSLTIQILNTGDSLRDVRASLVSNDSSVDIISGSSLYPDTLPGGKSLNTAPFKIYVRQQSDIYRASGIVLELYSQFSGKKERIEVPLYIGSQCTVLLVDDDGGSITESYIAETLTEIGIDFTVWNTLKRGIPDLTVMNPVMVIWNTGNIQGQVLTPDEITAIRNYLASGGALMIAGDEWADELVSDPLMHDYFRSNAAACDISPEYQIGASLLSGYNFYLPEIVIRRDRLSPLYGASILAADSSFLTAGSICLAHTSPASGPAVSAAYDISAMTGVSRLGLSERLLNILVRPEIISVTPYDSAINVAWRTYLSASYVEVRIRNSNGEVSVMPYYTGSAYISALANGMLYTASVRAVYGNGMKSEWSRETAVYPGVAEVSPLPAVDGITSVNGSGGIMFTWNQPADARVSSYNVEVYNKGGRIGFFNTSNNSFNVDRAYLGNNDSGTVVIYPVDSAGRAGIVSQSSWAYEDVYPPDDVADISVVKIEQNAIRITWRKTSSSDLKRYVIGITSPHNMTPDNADSGHMNSVIFRNIPDGVKSVITLRCEDLSGNLSSGSTVIWGTDGRGKGSTSGMCGCASEDNKSGDYKEAGILPAVISHLANFILAGMGLVITAVKRFIIKLRGKR